MNSLVLELTFGIKTCFGPAHIPLFYPRGCAAPLRGSTPIATLERFVVYCFIRADYIRPRPRARPGGHGELLKLLRGQPEVGLGPLSSLVGLRLRVWQPVCVQLLQCIMVSKPVVNYLIKKFV